MKFINKKLNAFTLSELLIALGVIGVLTAILLPIIFSMMPNQNTIMAKRAFATTQTVVSDLINDMNCYPMLSDRVGIDDGKGYNGCSGWGADASDDAGAKFVKLFTDKLDLASAVTVSNGITSLDFNTKDGISWKFQFLDSLNTKNSRGTYITLTADVNGAGNSPDCGQANETTKCTVNKGFDTFTMRIYESGKVQIIDGWAVEAVKTDKNLTSDDEFAANNVIGADTVNESNMSLDPCDRVELHYGDACCSKEPYKSKRACSKCYDETVSNASQECCQNEWIFDTLDYDVQQACCPYGYSEHAVCKSEGHENWGSNGSGEEYGSGEPSNEYSSGVEETYSSGEPSNEYSSGVEDTDGSGEPSNEYSSGLDGTYGSGEPEDESPSGEETYSSGEPGNEYSSGD